MKSPWVHSLRWRIQLWHGALLCLLVGGMMAAFYRYEKMEKVRVIDNQLQSLVLPLLPRVFPPGGPEEEPGPPGRGGPRLTGFTEFERGSFYYAAWDGGRRLISKSSTAPDLTDPADTGATAAQFFRTRGQARELAVSGPQNDWVLVGTSLVAANGELQQLAWRLAWTGLGILLIGLLGGWWSAGRALRPIASISATAREISAGKRAERINLNETESELGQLAEVLNETFAQQERAFAQQVRFTADASHELRTPLSVILTQVQLALGRERDGVFYRETLEICRRAAERMRAQINSLLQLARVDSGEFKLELAECDLALVAEEALQLMAPLATEKGAVYKRDLQNVLIKADAERLGQVVVNLIDNSLRHNSGAVEISVGLRRENDRAILTVADNGCGIPPADLPHVFERFYRADISRSSAGKGSGLGLAISQAIVVAHGGTIQAENRKNGGVLFTVSLPLQN